MIDIDLFPGFPDVGLIADRRGLAVADHRRQVQPGVVEQQFLPRRLRGDPVEEEPFIVLRAAVDELIDPDRPRDALEFALAQAVTQDVDELVFNPAFLKISFRLGGVETFALAEYLDVQNNPSAARRL